MLRKKTFWLFITVLFILPVLGDWVVFKNGNRLEVKNLEISEDKVTYTVNGLKASAPLRYIDLEATRKANDELQEQQQTAREKEAARRQKEELEDRIIESGGTALGHLATRRLDDAEIGQILDKWKKRNKRPAPSLGRQSRPASRDDVFEVPFQEINLMIHINAKLNGVSAHFMIDTGCTVTAINLQTARQANVDFDRLSTASVSTANGIVDFYMGEIAEFQAGTVVVRNMSCLVGDLDTNLLGQNFLQLFNVSYDNNRGVIFLRPR